MKIGIMTFHWAANHGAVLQAYALCNYLRETYGAEVEIVDYYPKNLEISFINAIKRIRPRTVLKKLSELKKEKQISAFRAQLPKSRRYVTNRELIEATLDYDVLIAGSDQIWNPFFLLSGEKKTTPVYYLNFGAEGTKKIAVSASFGCQELPEAAQKIAAPLLKQFHAIGVRENTGLDILRSMNIDSGVVTADPTALLPREAYLNLCSAKPATQSGGVVTCVLRRQTKQTKQLIDAICRANVEGQAENIELYSMPDWLATIRDSRLVVTNSFHCTMMCLKLHTPFAVVLENGKGAGMNDRFSTLLNMFGLTNRVVNDVREIESLSAPIDFSEVDRTMERYSQTLKSFIAQNIG